MRPRSTRATGSRARGWAAVKSGMIQSLRWASLPSTLCEHTAAVAVKPEEQRGPVFNFALWRFPPCQWRVVNGRVGWARGADGEPRMQDRPVGGAAPCPDATKCKVKNRSALCDRSAGGAGLLPRQPQREHDTECRTATGLALNAQLTVQQPHVAARHAQPETGAAGPSRIGALHLPERIEDAIDLIGGNADA